jgi:hypothetical protein
MPNLSQRDRKNVVVAGVQLGQEERFAPIVKLLEREDGVERFIQ